MGIKEVDISIVSADTEAKKIKYALSDNDRAGEYDEQQLAELVYPHIEEINLDEYKVDLGEAATLADVIEDFGPDLNDGTEDDVPEIDDTPAITQPGQLFTLGKHRLLCGDSTKAEDVARLMGGEKADMVFTDPPYGINRDPEWLNHVGKKRQALSSSDVLKGDDGSLDLSFLFQFKRRFIWGFPYIYDPEATGWIVWDKQPGVDKRGIVTPIEMASTTMRAGFDMVRCMWGGFYRAKGEEKFAHPTQKPLGACVPFIEAWANDGIIYDPFLGSGTTLIAAEKLNRRCYGMEIDPKYCDVIIKRYCDYTGADEDAVRATVN